MPCSTQLAVQPVGVTWTIIRRRQVWQNRGGSSNRAWTQLSCPLSASGRPHRSQKVVSAAPGDPGSGLRRTSRIGCAGPGGAPRATEA
ncbi:hypothetical protein BL254_00220 [Protofrankia sp. BMG5.30]|uniref:Phosphoglycerate kinase n=1 Tax=Protofrankia coriariae TaxID=1562887 RepID=A0ABR5F4X0_9ACTN|nr:hypothetical protein FrCorBMG51_09420 [Protofrankia coriariae]ONH38343.1 hypothetical protein BL254_00220 [Protofrankia sp. BMG5.30]